MKKYILSLLTFTLAVGLFFTTNASAEDVSGNYHEEGLRVLIDKGAISPDANGNYYPENKVTRGQFASILSKVLGLAKDTTKNFSDVPSNHKYAQEIKNAAAANIISGYEDGTFKPDAPIQRQHMALMLEKALVYLKKNTKPTITLSFADTGKILEPYREAVAIGYELGLINGSPDPKNPTVKYFNPSDNTTLAHASRFVQRLMEVKNDPIAIHAGTYQLKEIVNGSLVATSAKPSYNYSDLVNQITKDTQVITKGKQDKIFYMNSGFVVSDVYTTFYSETVKDIIGVAANTEMKYYHSDGTKVKVDLASSFDAQGHVGYADIYNVSLIPYSLSKGRHYYIRTNDNEIKHVLIDHETGKDTASYTFGKAPSEMQAGVKYYSWNGVDFTGPSGNKAFSYYNYYQWLPIHSKTQYTAEELNKYIDYALAERESINPVKYKDATKISKIKGLGEELKQIEADYNVNAMMLLALAMHESDFGMNYYSQNHNNLFSLYVNDTNPLNKEFDSPEANIEELMSKFFFKNYIPANGKFAHGSVFGNKRTGFNVKYASDPYWGAKAAGHYYRADKYLGFKDESNAYTIGMTNNNTSVPLNVRTQPLYGDQYKMYQYSRNYMPVIITDSSNAEWYQIIPDKVGTTEGYIHKDYVKVLNTTK